MCGTSPIIVKIINVMTKLNGFPSRLTGKTFLRNIMPVTLGQTNDSSSSLRLKINAYFFEFLYIPILWKGHADDAFVPKLFIIRLRGIHSSLRQKS